MRFDQAIARGNKVKRKPWGGYWEIVNENGEDKIYMHYRTGEIFEVRDTKDILFTLGNVCKDDWMVVND